MDSGHLSGVTGPTLTITSASLEDVGSYDAVITIACGSLVSPAGFLDTTVNQPSSQISLAADGSAVLDVLGDAGFTYAIQASTDLVTWSEIGTAVVIGPGHWQFTDTQRANYPVRFYRVVGQ